MNDQDNNTVSDSAIKELLEGYFKPAERIDCGLPCPGEEVLADYLGNRLDAAAQEDLERHLCRCEACLEAVTLGATLAEEEGRETISRVPFSAVKTLLARIGADERRLAPALRDRFIAGWQALASSLREIIFFKEPEAAYVRGSRHIISKNLVVIEKTFQDIKLEIEIEKIAEQSANIKVKTRSPVTGDRVDGIRVNILSNSREVASFITAGGEALFENIAFGEYSISAHQNGKKLGHLLLDVKES
jgi:hypothetical protein